MWLQKDLIREWGYSLDTVVEDRSLEKKSARDSIFTLREICKRKSSERNVVGEVDDGSKHVPGVGVTSHFGLVALFFVVDVRILSSTTRGSTKRDVGRRTEIVEQVMEVGGGRWRSVEVGGGWWRSANSSSPPDVSIRFLIHEVAASKSFDRLSLVHVLFRFVSLPWIRTANGSCKWNY